MGLMRRSVLDIRKAFSIFHTVQNKAGSPNFKEKTSQSLLISRFFIKLQKTEELRRRVHGVFRTTLKSKLKHTCAGYRLTPSKSVRFAKPVQSLSRGATVRTQIFAPEEQPVYSKPFIDFTWLQRSLLTFL